MDGGTRDQMARAYGCIFAGGGVATSRTFGEVSERDAVLAEEAITTCFHSLGMDPDAEITTAWPAPIAR